MMMGFQSKVLWLLNGFSSPWLASCVAANKNWSYHIKTRAAKAGAYSLTGLFDQRKGSWAKGWSKLLYLSTLEIWFVLRNIVITLICKSNILNMD
jgi:hypothetical protein